MIYETDPKALLKTLTEEIEKECGRYIGQIDTEDSRHKIKDSINHFLQRFMETANIDLVEDTPGNLKVIPLNDDTEELLKTLSPQGVHDLKDWTVIPNIKLD